MGAPVILNVYDLHDNSWIYWCGIGGLRAVEQYIPALWDGLVHAPLLQHIASEGVCDVCLMYPFAGIFHSGVEVYDVEYAYGGRPFSLHPLV